MNNNTDLLYGLQTKQNYLKLYCLFDLNKKTEYFVINIIFLKIVLCYLFLQSDEQKTYIYVKGCVPQFEKWLQDNLTVVAGVFIGIALLQVKFSNPSVIVFIANTFYLLYSYFTNINTLSLYKMNQCTVPQRAVLYTLYGEKYVDT